jgi:NitT/TauT family transport system substrate-binding protein
MNNQDERGGSAFSRRYLLQAGLAAVREEPQVARAVTQALLDAAMFTSQHPEQAAKSFQPYAPKTATLADLEGMVRYHTHHHHPVGEILKRELKSYADDLKAV